jgi:hypothetical protein
MSLASKVEVTWPKSLALRKEELTFWYWVWSKMLKVSNVNSRRPFSLNAKHITHLRRCHSAWFEE